MLVNQHVLHPAMQSHLPVCVEYTERLGSKSVHSILGMMMLHCIAKYVSLGGGGPEGACTALPFCTPPPKV